MDKLANALLNLKWEEMDDLASRIYEVATDDNGEINDPRFISQCLLDFAIENKT